LTPGLVKWREKWRPGATVPERLELAAAVSVPAVVVVVGVKSDMAVVPLLFLMNRR
jgi:hypothetical protein